MRKKIAPLAAAIGAALAAAGTMVVAQRLAVRQPTEDVGSASVRTRAGLQPNENLLFNGWGVTPAGTHVPLAGDMPLKMVVSPDGKTLAAVTSGYNNHGLTLIDVATKRVTQFLPLARAWNGLAWSRDGRRIFVSGGNSGLLHRFQYADGKATAEESVAPAPVENAPVRRNRRRNRNPGSNAPAAAAAPTGLPTFLAGIAVHPETGKLYIANEGEHEVWVVNPETRQQEDVIPVGTHPHSVVFGADRRSLYVSNWGGRSVSVVDTQTSRRIRDIPAGIRPNDMALAPDGRLFVACAGDNTVRVIQTRTVEREQAEATPAAPPTEGTREIIATSLYPSSPEGSTSSGVAISPDAKTLYVANSDNNSVMVVDIADSRISRVEGFIPVGWYPTAVAVSPDNGTLFVANGKGLRSRPNHPPQEPRPRRLHKGVPFNHPGQLFQGSVSVIAARPAPEQIARYTEQVRRNSPYTPETLRRAPIASSSVVPDRVGAPCPIKYVLYIIKENRTYDQIFGDMTDKQRASRQRRPEPGRYARRCHLEPPSACPGLRILG